MRAHANTTRITLARREIVALSDSRGLIVDCVSGELWVTADGVAGDHILGPGDRLKLTAASRVFISALADSALQATPCCGTSPVRRLANACAAAVADSIRRWRHTPLAAYPVTHLR